MRTLLRSAFVMAGALSIFGMVACSSNPTQPTDTNASATATVPESEAAVVSASTQVIGLKSAANNMFVSLDSATLQLKPTQASVGTTEKFILQTNTDGTVCLKSSSNNQYVSIDNLSGGPMKANRGAADAWEQFRIVTNTDGTISLRSTANNYFVCAEGGGSNPLIANRGSIGTWEKFYQVNQGTPTPTPPPTGKSAKRGIAYDVQTAADLNALKGGVSWWYNWGVGTNAAANYKATYGMDYIPMSWNGNNIAIGGAVDNYLTAHPECKYLLVMNEPNFWDQANKTIAEVVAMWPQIEAVAQKHGAKIVGPALNWGTVNSAANPSDPVVWLDGFFSQFRAKYGREPQVDAIAFHWYDYGLVGSGTGFLDDPKKLPKFGKKIWVTEFANWHTNNDGAQIDTVAKQKEQMRQWVSWMETHDIVERYSWFTGRQGGNPCYISLFQNYGLGANQGDGVLSELGQYYVSLPVGK